MAHAAELIKELEAAGVPYAKQGGEGYEAQLHQRTFTVRPDAIFRPAVFAKPRTIEEVSAAVKAGAKVGVKVIARSGGHSSCGISLGGRDDQLVVDLGHFDEIEADPANHTAIIGAAQRLGPVYLALAKHGEAMSGGECPSVGIGGHLAHGGSQTAHRAVGTAMDQVFAYDAVMADGSIVHVTQKTHPDLFWALKGFASSYAIITRFHIKTFTPPPKNTLFKWTFTTDVKTATGIWRAFQKWSSTRDASGSKFARFGLEWERPEKVPAGQTSFWLVGHYLGTIEEWSKDIKSLKSQLPAPDKEELDELSWIDLLDKVKIVVTEEQGLALKGYDLHLPYYERSLLLTQDLPEAAVREFFDYLTTYEYGDGPYASRPFLQYDLMGGYDSYYNKISPKESSVPRRKQTKWLLWLYWVHWDNTVPDDIEPHGRAFVNHLHEIIEKHTPSSSRGAYFNVPDLKLKDAPLRYFGENHQRLAELKYRFDPDDVFSTPTTVKGVKPRSWWPFV